MTNAKHALLKERTLDLDVPRKAVLNLKAFALLEETLGKSAFRAINFAEPGIGDLRLLLFASLLPRNEITLDEFDELVPPWMLMQVRDDITAMLEEAFSPQREAEEKNEKTTTTTKSNKT